MRVSQLLKELNISLKSLREYEPFLEDLEFNFNVLNQMVPDEVYNKIIEIHKVKENQNLNTDIKQVPEKPKLLVFQDKESYRFVAKVLWYYNYQTDGEYGFLKKEGIPDIKFDKSNYFGKSISEVVKGAEYIVTVKKTELDQKRNRIQASKINSFSDEEDANFLVFHFLNFYQELTLLTANKIIASLNKLNYLADEKTVEFIDSLLDDLLKHSIGNIEKIQLLHNFLITIKYDHLEFIRKVATINLEVAFKLWTKDTNLNLDFELIKSYIVNDIISSQSNATALFSRLNDKEKNEIVNNLLDFYFENELQKIDVIYNILISNEISLDSFYSKIKKLSPDEIFKIWVEISSLEIDFEILEIDFDIFKGLIIDYITSNSYTTSKVLKRLGIEKQIELLNNLLISSSKLNYSIIQDVILLYKELGLTIDFGFIKNDTILKLWFDDILSFCPIDSIIETLKIASVEYLKNENVLAVIEDTLKIFEKCSEEELKNVLAKILYNKEVIDDEITFRLIHFTLINLSYKEDDISYMLGINICPPDILNNFIQEVYKKSSNYYRLKLFIIDYTDEIVFNDVIIYTGLLSAINQKIFFKKIIKLIAENKINVSLDDLNRITTIDFETSEQAKEIDGVGLDFTLNIILKIITDLKENKVTSRTTIFDVIANQIKKPDDLLVIDGFFESCTGKTIVEIDKETFDDETEEKITSYKIVKKENYLPRFSTFCDGRKSIDKITEKPNLCKKSGFEFWWCENSQCYDACRKSHNPSDWRKYTLEDTLRILQIPYSNSQYEIMLNVINRVNRFLKHLTCKECNSILKPKGKSNYAFYGVSMFNCDNADCIEHKKEIYLSHCMNGNCEDIIDSRNSAKCKNKEYSDDCGWYICKSCNACCSSEKLAARKNILENFGQEYKCHIEGHRDRGILCCSDCGHEMYEKGIDSKNYSIQLNWFIEQKDKHPNIVRYGKRGNDNKWWFLWTRGEYSYDEYRKQITNLNKYGFNIPDFNNKESDQQLISEPFENRNQNDKIFICPNCDHQLNLGNNEEIDYGRKLAIQKFHNNIFKVIR